MSRALFFHLRKQINASMPGEFGSGKSLQPNPNFNNDGRITYDHGDFGSLVARLQTAVGQSYVIEHNEAQKSITIKRITDIN